MTKEEAIKVLSESIHDGSKVPWNKIVEAVHLSIEALSRPSILSNLDEAAEDSWAVYEYRESPRGLYSTCYVDGFKAGAEWMAGQFQKIEGNLVDWYSTSDGKDYCCGIKTDGAFEIPEGFYIRKKQPGFKED